MKTSVVLLAVVIGLGGLSLWSTGMYIRTHEQVRSAIREWRDAEQKALAQGLEPPPRVHVDVKRYDALAAVTAVLAVIGSSLVTWTYRKRTSTALRAVCTFTLLLAALALMASLVRV